MKQVFSQSLILVFSLHLLGSSAFASGEAVDGMAVSKELLNQKYPGKTYSPYAERDYPMFPLWGDSHLHTGYSMDAGLFGATLKHEDAYRLAQGEQIKTNTGQSMKLSRALDWLVITDHSDQMGMVQDIIKGDKAVMATEQGRRWHDGMKKGGDAAAETTMDLITTFSNGQLDPKLIEMYSPGSNNYDSVWAYMVDTAEEYNDPGRFSAMIGFEWTSLVEGANMHRNVILRDDGDLARKIVPYTTQKPLGSVDPLDLYAWLENDERKIG